MNRPCPSATRHDRKAAASLVGLIPASQEFPAAMTAFPDEKLNKSPCLREEKPSLCPAARTRPRGKSRRNLRSGSISSPNESDIKIDRY